RGTRDHDEAAEAGQKEAHGGERDGEAPETIGHPGLLAPEPARENTPPRRGQGARSAARYACAGLERTLSCRGLGDGIGGRMEPTRGRGDLIDGSFVVGPAADGVLLESRDPARDFEVGFTVTSHLAHVDAAVAAAKKAQRAWHACGVETRKAYLERLKGVFKAHVDGIAEAITRETGKPHREALAEARSLGARV